MAHEGGIKFPDKDRSDLEVVKKLRQGEITDRLTHLKLENRI